MLTIIEAHIYSVSVEYFMHILQYTSHTIIRYTFVYITIFL